MGSVKHKLLIIDDTPAIREAMSTIFQDDYVILTAEDGPSGIKIARSEKPSIIILDINMPGLDGLTVCKQLRDHAATSNIPIIISSGNSLCDARIKAFTFGADDFIPRPFEIEEIEARVKSKIRRLDESPNTTNEIVFDHLKLNINTLELSIHEKPVHLSVLEFSLLKCFLNNIDRVIDRKFILERVWYDSVVGKRTIDTHVVSLRKRLNGYKSNLITCHGAGYIFKSTLR